MRPIQWKINGVPGWYIWSDEHKDILEGEDCGPFLSELDCLRAIEAISLNEMEKKE